MNRAKTDSNVPARSETASVDDREFFVTTDFQSMPVMELLRLRESVGQWIAAVFRYKVLRTKTEPEYAIECRRIVKATHVPKRIQKYFDTLTPKLEMSGFEEAFHATVAAIGPYSSATLVMSREDEEMHFFASQAVTKIDGRIEDEAYFGFTTWLKDGNAIVTMSPVKLPNPRAGVDRLIVDNDDPTSLLRKHHERIRRQSIDTVPASELFDRFEAENQKQTDDWLARGVIRVANPAEVTRIRNAMRV